MWDQRAANAKKTKRPADAADDGSAGGRNAKPAATDVRIDPITGELRQPVDLKPRVEAKKMPTKRRGINRHRSSQSRTAEPRVVAIGDECSAI